MLGMNSALILYYKLMVMHSEVSKSGTSFVGKVGIEFN